jgi:hypothetical protein
VATARELHTATLLANGNVLIGFGINLFGFLSSAELYDPITGTFSATGSTTTGRLIPSATLLPNGKVLIAGGQNSSRFLSSAELYDVGDGYAESRRPVISPTPTTVNQPSGMTLSGNGFRGDSEASSGASNSSPTNYPLLQLQRLDNDETLFIRGAAWNDTSFMSTTLSGLANGHYRATINRATIVTNAIPSLQGLVRTAISPLPESSRAERPSRPRAHFTR